MLKLVVGGTAALIIGAAVVACASGEGGEPAARTQASPTAPVAEASRAAAETPTAQPETPTPTISPEDGAGIAESLEYKLAVVNADGYVPEDDPSVKEFRRLLDALDRYCPESRERIADMLVVTNQQIGDRGGSEGLLETTRSLKALLEPLVTELVGDSCADEFALWVMTAAP